MPTAHDNEPAVALAGQFGRALRDQDPGLVIAYGGPSAPLPDGSTPTIRLPDDLRDAVAALRTALGAAPSR